MIVLFLLYSFASLEVAKEKFLNKQRVEAIELLLSDKKHRDLSFRMAESFYLNRTQELYYKSYSLVFEQAEVVKNNMQEALKKEPKHLSVLQLYIKALLVLKECKMVEKVFKENHEILHISKKSHLLYAQAALCRREYLEPLRISLDALDDLESLYIQAIAASIPTPTQEAMDLTEQILEMQADFPDAYFIQLQVLKQQKLSTEALEKKWLASCEKKHEFRKKYTWYVSQCGV